MTTFHVLVGDALERLRALPSGLARVCVTSPPYWGLRDYKAAGQIGLEPTLAEYLDRLVAVFREVGRVLTDDGTLWLNLGDCHVARNGATAGAIIPGRDDGRAFTNGQGGSGRCLTSWSSRSQDRLALGGVGLKPKDLVGLPWRVAFALQADGWYLRSDIVWHKPNPMPESVTDRPTRAHEYMFLLAKSPRYHYDAAAIAEPVLYGDNARNGNGDPEFVVQAPGQKVQTGITRRRRDGNRVPSGWDTGEGSHRTLAGRYGSGNKERKPGTDTGVSLSHVGRGIPWEDIDGKRNRRTVWTIATKPFRDAHFATFPPALVEPCILAGSQTEGHKRCDCAQVVLTPLGEVEEDDRDSRLTDGRRGYNRPRSEDEGTEPITRRQQRHHAREIRRSPHLEQMKEEAGPALEHYVRGDRSGGRPVRPALRALWSERGWITDAGPCECRTYPTDVVLDPFAGAGTTGLVAHRLGRSFVGIEINPKYAAMARERVRADAPLLYPEESPTP